MQHYRQYKVWITDTRAEQTSQTIVWFPKWVPLPKTSSHDIATLAALDLIHALQNPTMAGPLLPLPDSQLKSLRQLANIFQAATKKHPKADAMPIKDTGPAPRVESKENSLPHATFANKNKSNQLTPYEPNHHHNTRLRNKYLKALQAEITRAHQQNNSFHHIYSGATPDIAVP